MTNHPEINTTITCDGLDAVLEQYLEGELLAPERKPVEAHLGECLRCAALVRDLMAIRRDAARLPELEPSRDLWEGIAARIDTPVIPLGQSGQRVSSGRTLRLGLAAAALVVVTAGVTYLATVRGLADPTTGSPAVAQPAGGSDGAPGASSVTVAQSEASATLTYDMEIMRLRAVLDLRRNDLDPATVAIVESSLTTINQAIADARIALAQDPASRFLVDQLNKALEKKLGLLRTVALLPPRI